LAIKIQERESSVVKAKTLYGSLTIGECKFCGGEAVLVKGRYKTYMFCSHCDKVYKVKQQEMIAGSMLLN
jgi:ssDNA-binding Zn-finger/Zn-ribbon topoisomerase 1